MDFPNVSEIADALKGMVTGDSDDATTDAETQVDVTTDAPAETVTSTTTAQEPEKPVETSTTEPLHATVAKVITEKGARAFISELPEEIRKQLGPELNKEWYTKLNERDAENRRLAAQTAAIPDLIKQVVADQFDAIRMESMSPEDKKAFQEQRELARLREATKAKDEEPSPEEVARRVASHPATAEFWRIVKEAGLPQESVTAIWREGYSEPTPEAAIAKFRDLAAQHKAKLTPAATKPEDLEALVNKKVAEALEAAVDKKLKAMGALRADTGKPAGTAGGKQSTSWDVVRKEAEQAFRESAR